MPCLDKIHKQLVELVPEAKRECTAHIVGALYCPNYSEEPRIHSRNGIFVVAIGDDVFATCSDQSCFSKHRMASQTSSPSSSTPPRLAVEVVEGTERWSRPWVKYTEQSYTGLEHRANQRKKTAAASGNHV
jgi:hypothetical protein